MNLQPEIRICNGKPVRFYTPQQLDEMRHATAPDFQRERTINHSHPLAHAGVVSSTGFKTVGSAKFNLL